MLLRTRIAGGDADTKALHLNAQLYICSIISPVPRYNAHILMRYFAEEKEELTSAFVLYCPFRRACAPSIRTHMLGEEGETGSCGWVTNTEVEETESACACAALQSGATLEPNEGSSQERAVFHML